jgi:hypothetical protein
VGAHVLAWLGAAGALYALARMAGGSSRAAVLAAGLAATGPGFIGYLGQVDAHPFAYAAVAVWLALLERLGVFAPAPHAGVGWLRPVVAGLALCVAAHTIEIGYPLLLFVWLFYGAVVLRGGPVARTRLVGLALLTGAFLIPYLGFRLLAERFLFEQVVPFNDPQGHMRSALTSAGDEGLAAWLSDQTRGIAGRWLVAYPPLLSGLALIGALAVGRRWLLWAGTLIGVICLAIMITKPLTRELFLTFPAVYVLAACGIDRVGTWLGDACAPAAVPARRAWLNRLFVAVLFLAVVGVTNADLWGDYSLPAHWYA